MSVYKKYTNVNGGSVPIISGSKGGGGCFPAGSLVSTPHGEIPIEDIKINDKVYCFDDNDKRWASFVEKTWEHVPSKTVGYILTLTHEKGVLRVTDNHYLYDESNEYKEAKDWKVGEYLTLEDNDFSKILSIESEDYLDETVYNLTVNTYHNYICQGIRLSNKGGGKGGGGARAAATESPNTLFSTDILFLTVALGEGPIYRINPNGPQDIEINEGAVDDLINIDGDGEENNEVFKTLTTTGTLTQEPLAVFGAETITPQNLNNAVSLKKGNVEGIPKASVILQNTSAKDWDKIRFNFIIQGLQKSDGNGNVSGSSVSITIQVFDRTGTTLIAELGEDGRTVSGKTNTRFKFQRDILIPETSRSLDGYKFTIEKTSSDSDSNRTQDNVQFVGWDEIEFDDMAYPRTSLIGYAIKSFNEHEGRVPTFTSLIKGLLVKVPANYNQPVLSNGEIDWRQLEVPETGTITINGESTQVGYTQRGYRLQTTVEGTAKRKVSSISIQTNGSGYASDATPSVTISGGGGSGAGATTTISSNKVTTINISNVGSNYTTTPTVAIAAPAAITFNGASAVSDGSETITLSGHPFATGDQATYSAGGGTAISGTGVSVASGGVFIIKIDANTVKLATSASNANAGTAIDITSGSGASHTLTGMTATATVTLTSEQFNANPIIYQGVWDGTFVYSWTQNPIWIVYDILTNKTYGLGIDEENIDKFMFYKVAQYCDACDFTTGGFVGVDGFADGTFRHKPLGLFSTVREILVGLDRGVQVKERRFMNDISIQEDVQVMDTVNKITSTFRGLLYYAGGKITLNIDIPEDTPVAIFNDANIKRDTLKFSGTKESDIITGVDVSYIEPANHFKREVVRIDDQEALRDRNQIENITTVDLAGVTRRSQASRYGQYLIASSKYLRRQVEFQCGVDALNLVVGDVITVATKQGGIAYGFGGKVAADSQITGGGVTNANILLEHFTSPAITASTFTSNNNPLAVRVIGMASDRIDYYLVDNVSFTANSTGNADSGIDLLEIETVARFNYKTKAFASGRDFLANNVPKKGDLWSFGETGSDPDNFYTSQNDRLFKITSIARGTEEDVTITGVEYISNVYVDSDSLIAYVPVRYDDTVSPLTPPPAPELNLSSRPRELGDGSVTNDLLVDVFTDQTGYPLFLETDLSIASPDFNFVPYLTSNANTGTTTFTASNTSPLANGEVSILSGKNGFKTNTGEIKLLVDAVTNPDVTDTSNGNVQFSIKSLNLAFDINQMKHVLEVNDGGGAVANVLKGFDRVSFDLNQKLNTGTGLLGFVDHGTRLTQYSANIVSHSTTMDAGTIKIQNEHSGESTLLDQLPTPPFYVSINQLVDTRFMDNRSLYISGSSFTEIHSNVITGNLTASSSFIQPLVRGAPFKESVRVFIDGIEKTTGDWNFTSSANDSITVPGLSTEATIRIEAEHYTVPAVEPGDNLQFHSGNVYSIVNASYSTDSADFNASLTANNMYRVTLGSQLRSNTRGTVAVNISPDPIGTTNNVFGNSFTFDYNKTLFPGSFSLANNAIYSVLTPTTFDGFQTPADRLVRAVDPGLYVLRAQNVNQAGRRSPIVTESILINEIPIQRVENLLISESLYIEQSVGAVTRVTVEFDHLQNQSVTDYELSYKLGGEAADLTSFNTVKLPSTGVDTDGKMRFTINNVDRGLTSSVNNITVRVTALNKAIKGVTLEKSQAILGKQAPPQNIQNFSVSQLGENIHLFWAYVTNADGSLFDPDLRDIVIKRAHGTVQPDDFASAFVNAPEFIVVSSGSTRKVAAIDTFGTFTYLAKTRDTSGNLSTDVVGVTFTSVKLAELFLLQSYSEDNPGGNVVSGVPLDNRTEFNFPSLANSNTAGLSISAQPTSLVDNANGTAIGFSVISGSPTDILATGSQSIYQTQVRDIGALTSVSLTANIQGTATTSTDWNTLHQDKATGVTEVSSDNTILKDTGLGGSEGVGTVLGFSNTVAAAVSFNAPNQTLTSGGASGNVFAIWNDGQYSTTFSDGAGVKTITAITQAEPGIITVSADHFLATTTPATRSIIHDVVGMTQLNSREVYVTRSTSNTTLQLFNYTAKSGVTISAVTKANPAVVTASGHGLSDGDKVIIQGVVGMTELNGLVFTVANKTTNTFELSGTNSSAFTTYSSGGVLHEAINTSAGHSAYSSSGVVDLGDYSNANSYALIASVIDADEIKLGKVYHANGASTGANAFANLTTVASSYKLVDLNQFSDSSSAATTFLGDSSALSRVTQIRTSESDPFFANGNVNISTFSGTSDDRFTTFSTGSRLARFFQIREIITNAKPTETNFTLDTFEYTVDKPTQEFRARVTFAGTSDTGGNTAVDYSSAGFIEPPFITMTPVGSIGKIATVIGSTNTGANINVVNSSDQAPSTGVVLDFVAQGI